MSFVFRSLLVAVFVAGLLSVDSLQAQRRPVVIGGPNGLIMGGGQGFKLGGRNGVHFGGGQGAKFGPPEFGMHFGNGQGARFGGTNLGMQFGGGNGAKFGPVQIGGRGPHPTIADRVRANNGIDKSLTIADRVRMNNGIPVNPNNNLARPNEIVVAYSAENANPVRYSLNGTPYQLAPGTTIRMPAGYQWEFVVLDGDDRRPHRIVEPGNYELKQADGRWSVQSAQPIPATILPANDRSLPNAEAMPQLVAPQGPESAATVNGTFDIADQLQGSKNSNASTATEPSASATGTPESQEKSRKPKSVLDWFKSKSGK